MCIVDDVHLIAEDHLIDALVVLFRGIDVGSFARSIGSSSNDAVVVVGALRQIYYVAAVCEVPNYDAILHEIGWGIGLVDSETIAAGLRSIDA